MNKDIDTCLDNIVSSRQKDGNVMPRLIDVDNALKAFGKKDFFTIAEVRRVCGVSRQTVYNWIAGGLKCSKEGKFTVFRRDDLVRYIRENKRMTFDLGKEERRVINILKTKYDVISKIAKQRKWSLMKTIDEVIGLGLKDIMK